MQTIINRANGIIGGASGDHAPTLTDLTGLALAVQNGPLGTTTIENQKDGKITAGIIASSTRAVPDAPVIAAAYGGGQVNITNDGTIIGRVAPGRSCRAPRATPSSTPAASRAASRWARAASMYSRHGPAPA